MGFHPIAHPPTSQGATTRELQVIAALHRAATTTPDQPAASAMLDGMALIVELIGERDKRRGPVEVRDLDQGEAPEGWVS